MIKLLVSNAEDSRVNQILVRVGDLVKPNQVIAILQGEDQRLADLKAAQSNVALRRAQLTKVRQGEAKSADIKAQKSVINRLKAQQVAEAKRRRADIARAEAVMRDTILTLGRQQSLHDEGAVGRAELDTARREHDTSSGVS